MSRQTREANEVWEVLKKDHYFWTNVDQVLQLCQLDETKCFMLVLLQDNVKVPHLSGSKSGRHCHQNNRCSSATSWWDA